MNFVRLGGVLTVIGLGTMFGLLLRASADDKNARGRGNGRGGRRWEFDGGEP